MIDSRKEVPGMQAHFKIKGGGRSAKDVREGRSEVTETLVCNLGTKRSVSDRKADNLNHEIEKIQISSEGWRLRFRSWGLRREITYVRRLPT
ncbi:hypothetical protein JTB14_020852 [Gonioctena quinquepunctata]|nr:hypothetical protein JTB14_020852 [Gonioctena quinquepunctata]